MKRILSFILSINLIFILVPGTFWPRFLAVCCLY